MKIKLTLYNDDGQPVASATLKSGVVDANGNILTEEALRSMVGSINTSVAELVYAEDLKPSDSGHVGSTPTAGTKD